MQRQPSRCCHRRASTALALLLLAAPAAADPLYDRGTAEWKAALYPAAATDLVQYRAKPGGRTADVDYKIGTSGCRIPGERRQGANYLAHALKRYPLTPASVAVISRELTRCLGAAPMPALEGGGAETAIAATAGATTQGKMFYSVNATEAVAAYPARPLGEPDRAKLRGRLTQVGDEAGMTAKLRALVPASATIAIINRFAFVDTAGHSNAQLTQIAATLDQYLRFLDRQYGIALPPEYLTIYLVRDVGELRAVARNLHNLDVSPATIGYTFQDDRSAVAVIPGMVTGTLLHELFHLAVRQSFGDIPQWLDEGIASLYEVSAIGPDGVTGRPNWRGPVLEQLWSEKPTLDALIGAPWLVSDAVDYSQPFNRPDVTPGEIAVRFATARYLALFLQNRGQLGRVFAAVRDLQPGTEEPAMAERKAVEAITGPLDRLQADWERWFRNGAPENVAATGRQTGHVSPAIAHTPTSGRSSTAKVLDPAPNQAAPALNNMQMQTQMQMPPDAANKVAKPLPPPDNAAQVPRQSAPPKGG